MNGNQVSKIIRAAEPAASDQIASLKERMAVAQAQVCALLDETLVLGLKWNFNLKVEDGRHKCDATLIREY